MSDILSSISTRKTPQTERSRPDQVKNAAGGHVFAIGDRAQAHRFLTLGTMGGTYYTSEKGMTRENADVIFRLSATDALWLINEIVEVSTAGRAPKQDQGLFALAVVASHADDAGRVAALSALPQVARTASTLFKFVGYTEQFRGWGRGLRNAVTHWYTGTIDSPRSVEQLAYQLVKYRNRDGWMHADLLRKAHVTGSPEQNALLNWVAATSPTAGVRRTRHGKGKDLFGETVDVVLPALVGVFEELQQADKRRAVSLIRENRAVSWEMLPDSLMNDKDVWAAMIDNGVPQTALMRQLPRLTNLGLCSGDSGRTIAAQLVDVERLRKARVHPINVLVAQKTYAQGHGEKGKLTWTPERVIADALNDGFYAAYGAVEPSNVRILDALDVSGSMTMHKVSGLPLDCREAAAALSLVSANVERDYEVVGFSSGTSGYSYYGRSSDISDVSGLSKLDISPRRRLDDVNRYVANLPFGGTDCSLPMRWAQKNKLAFDAFRIFTDNETWAGPIHTYQALENYRQAMGINARLVVVAMTATGNSVTDQKDLLQLDISGFDSAVPQLLGDFSAGRI